MLSVKFSLLSAACAVSIEITNQLQSDPNPVELDVENIDWGSVETEIPDDLVDGAADENEVIATGDWTGDVDWENLEENAPEVISDYQTETEALETGSNAITSVAIAMTSLVLSTIMLV